jgi:hypothetical protein
VLLDRAEEAHSRVDPKRAPAASTDKSLIELNLFGTWTVKIARSSTIAIGMLMSG